MAVSRTRGREIESTAPKSDIYTGLLAISLVAMLIGCALLYLDYASYPPQKPTPPPAPTLSPAVTQPPAGGALTPPAGGGGNTPPAGTSATPPGS
jgi:hypothetical protein